MSTQIKIGTSVAIIAIAFVLIASVIVSVHSASAHKLTATSYSDGYAKGQNDAQRDYYGANGHGYDSSCPASHTDVYCSGYVHGYRSMWASMGGSGQNQFRNVQDQNTDQAQSSSVNVRGNNNHVNVHQGQASSSKEGSIAYGIGRGVKHLFDGLSDPECDSNGYCN